MLTGSIFVVIAIIRMSLILVILGFICILVTLPIKAMWWKCPYCSAPLPWRKMKPNNYHYRCMQCGKEIEGI